MDFGDELPLNATVPVDHWGFLNRRVRYLEAVIVQILGDQSLLKEWYTAGELADFQLPGLPRTRQGIARLATARSWRSRIVMQRGHEARVYHCTVLPDRAFDGLLDRIICRGAMHKSETAFPTDPTPVAMLPPIPARASNTAPPWVLPLLRLVRASGSISIASAVRQLPQHLPAGTTAPTYQEAEQMLRQLGFVT